MQDDEDPELVLDLDGFLSSDDRLLLDGAGEECKPESGDPARLNGSEDGASPSPRWLPVCLVAGRCPEETEASPPAPSSRAGRAEDADDAAGISRDRRLAESSGRMTRGLDQALAAGSRLDRFPFCFDGLRGLLNGLLLFG